MHNLMLRVLQELLEHCLALFEENQQRIAALEGHLVQYGYKPPQNFPAVQIPVQLQEEPGELRLAAMLSNCNHPGFGRCNSVHVNRCRWQCQ